jgi:hypothetical protein
MEGREAMKIEISNTMQAEVNKEELERFVVDDTFFTSEETYLS